MNCECGQEVAGKGKYCSAKCKQRAYRNRTVTEPSPGVTVTVDNVVTAAKYLHPTDPDTLEIWARHKAQQRPTVYPDLAGKGIYA